MKYDALELIETVLNLLAFGMVLSLPIAIYLSAH